MSGVLTVSLSQCQYVKLVYLVKVVFPASMLSAALFLVQLVICGLMLIILFLAGLFPVAKSLSVSVH